ncbi:MAG: response regulator transcription factor [Chloroflexota bacterium]|nr:response regulator transcription factor [Chloroflexota bacterium]
MTEPIRVLIVDDHAIVREGLRTLLSDEPGLEVIGEAADGSQAVAAASAHQPDVILMDLLMPEVDGIEATRRVRQAGLPSQVIVLTSFADDQRVRDALQAGAIGYLIKDVLRPELVQAIRAAAQGLPALHPTAQQLLLRHLTAPPTHQLTESLTERELEVLRLISQGLNNRQIAKSLHLTEGTVKGYVSIILGKLGVEDRTQAALFALKHGLASLE